MTGPAEGNEGRDPVRNPGQTGISGLGLAGAGVQFAAILVVSSLAGIWADRQLGTSPWLLIVFVFAGAAAAFYSLYRKLIKGQRLGERRVHPERREEDE